ncbi:MAG: DUF3575 domain-containing protein [Bacteroidota bacterium]
MNWKRFLPVLLVLGLSTPVFSQAAKDSLYKNTIKLNGAAIMFNKASLLYERDLRKNWSVILGAGYRWGGNIPGVFGLGDVVVTSNTRGFRGYSISPELRYYFNYCDCGGPHTGFYAGLYGRYTKFYGNVQFNIWNGTDYVDVGGAGNLREFGGGLQLGYQFVFKKRFVVDLMFAGPRRSHMRMDLSLESEFIEDVIPVIEEEINKRLAWFGKDPISIDIHPEVNFNFGFTNFRYAVAIGYRF